MTPPSTPLPSFDPVLDRMREDSGNCFNTSGITLHPIRTIVGPFSRVLELEVRGGEKPLRVYVKILRPRFETPAEIEATRHNVTREFNTLSKVHRALGELPSLAAVRPIACYPELFAVVTQALEGEPLSRVLSRLHGFPSSGAIETAADVMRKVGGWLKAFQNTDAAGEPVSLERMRAYLDARLRPLVDLGVCSESMRRDVLRYFDRRASDVPASDLAAVPVHADFTLENVLVGGGRVGVLDFTMAKQSTRFLDVTHMFMHLEMLKARPWFRPGNIDHQTRALLSGYDQSLHVDRALFELLLLQNVVCFLLQSAQTNVSRLPARLLTALVRQRQLNWLASLPRSSPR